MSKVISNSVSLIRKARVWATSYQMKRRFTSQLNYNSKGEIWCQRPKSLECNCNDEIISVNVAGGPVSVLHLWPPEIWITYLFIIWLAPWTRKMNQVLPVIGYLSGKDEAILPARDYPPCPVRDISPKTFIINYLLTKLVRSRWRDVGLVLRVT